jgi:hypothetical protein
MVFEMVNIISPLRVLFLMDLSDILVRISSEHVSSSERTKMSQNKKKPTQGWMNYQLK